VFSNLIKYRLNCFPEEETKKQKLAEQ